MNCPLLKTGEHYDIGTRWAVIMRAMVSTPLPIRAEPLDFLTGEQVLATWTGEEFQIHPRYACDGYSPVVRVCGRWLRITPTPPCGLWPSVLHDALRQFMDTPGCPWTRQDTDAWFYDAMIAGGLHPHHAGIYHGAVAGPVGTAWLKLTRQPDPKLTIRPAIPVQGPGRRPAPRLQARCTGAA